MPLAARLRMTLLMIVFVYPLVTGLLYVIMPLTPGWELWQRSLILVPIMASCLILVIVPFVSRRFRVFIAGKPARAS